MHSSLHVFASFGEQSDSKSREALDKQAPSKIQSSAVQHWNITAHNQYNQTVFAFPSA